MPPSHLFAPVPGPHPPRVGRRPSYVAALAVACLSAPAAAQADSWVVNIGGQAALAPPYEGANHDVVQPMPTFTVRRASIDRRFTPPDDGSSFALLSTPLIDFGPVVRGREARSDKGQLTGFARVGLAVEPGLYVDVWPRPWLRGRLEVRRGVIGHQGWIADAGADLISTGSRWDASIGPRVGWGDRRYMRTYFGVSDLAAARSPLVNTPYLPGAGQRYAGLEGAFSYRISRSLRVTYGAGYQRLTSVAAESPIVRRAGNPNQYVTSLGFSYRFRVGR